MENRPYDVNIKPFLEMMEKTKGLKIETLNTPLILKLLNIHTNMLFELFIIERKCYRFMTGITDIDVYYKKPLSAEIEYLLNLTDIDSLNKIINLRFSDHEFDYKFTSIPLEKYPNNHLLPKEFDYIYKPEITKDEK